MEFYIMSSRVEIRSSFNDALIALGKPTVTKTEIKQICKNLGISGAQWFTKVDSKIVLVVDYIKFQQHQQLLLQLLFRWLLKFYLCLNL
jgi:hypothetical protein